MQNGVARTPPGQGSEEIRRPEDGRLLQESEMLISRRKRLVEEGLGARPKAHFSDTSRGSGVAGTAHSLRAIHHEEARLIR